MEDVEDVPSIVREMKRLFLDRDLASRLAQGGPVVAGAYRRALTQRGAEDGIVGAIERVLEGDFQHGVF